ncbi:MAG: hypothetical protein ABI670_19880 [Chloroflexota bacterium]
MLRLSGEVLKGEASRACIRIRNAQFDTLNLRREDGRGLGFALPGRRSRRESPVPRKEKAINM